MDVFTNLAVGLDAILNPSALVACFIGCLTGTLIGVLPGIGPLATIAMLLPMTYGLEPVSAMVMLAGIYYGAQYGGSTTAILCKMPGEVSSIITTIDGHELARQGRAGAALTIAAIGSFVAGCFATVVIAFLAPLLASVALKFNSPEYFALMVLGLIASAVLSSGSVINAILMILLGLWLGLVGTDTTSGMRRFTFGVLDLADGIDFVSIAIGLFGISEIIRNLETGVTGGLVKSKIKSLLPTRDDWRRATPAIARGSIIGSALGILPGGGAMLSAFASYIVEKSRSKRPEEFGKGAIEGVAGPESANNAGAQTSFIPMLTLGIPSNALMALFIGALLLQGIQPGPNVVTKQPALFWGLVVSMWIGNLMLVIINLPLVGIWIKLLRMPYTYLYPAIILLCGIGIYSTTASFFQVGMAALFGVVGYLLLKLDCEPAPLVMGFILGPMMEENLRRSLILSRGDPTIFVTHPISATLLVAAALLLALNLFANFRKGRDEVFQE